MNKLELQKMAVEVRKGIVTGVHSAKSGHPGGSLSAADIFTYLFFEELNIDPKNPDKADRDRFVLSKGHTAPGYYAAFGFHVIEVDGHDFDALKAAFDEAKQTKGQPTAIIAKTVKGKGVSFMENQCSWHGTAPNDEQYAQAMEELEKAGESLCQK